MLSIDTIQSTLKTEDITCIEVYGSRETIAESMLILTGGCFNDLLSFIKANHINTVFYSKAFYNPEMFMITEEEISALDPEIYDIVKDSVIQHNKSVEKVDFGVPVQVDVFCLYEGHKIGIVLEKEWFFDEDLIVGSDKLIEIFDTFEDKIKALEEKRQVYVADLKSELQELILKDENFARQTNQNLRKEYLYNILKRKSMTKYHSIFEMREGYLNPHKIQNFIDLVWKIYKYEKA